MDANRKQAAEDWETNLTHRAAELKSGGYLVATVPTYTPGTQNVKCCHMSRSLALSLGPCTCARLFEQSNMSSDRGSKLLTQ